MWFLPPPPPHAHINTSRLFYPSSVIQEEKVNVTAEEDVEDDEDVPDLRVLGENAGKTHFFPDQANGIAHLNRHLLHFQ